MEKIYFPVRTTCILEITATGSGASRTALSQTTLRSHSLSYPIVTEVSSRTGKNVSCSIVQFFSRSWQRSQKALCNFAGTIFPGCVNPDGNNRTQYLGSWTKIQLARGCLASPEEIHQRGGGGGTRHPQVLVATPRSAHRFRCWLQGDSYHSSASMRLANPAPRASANHVHRLKLIKIRNAEIALTPIWV